MSKWNSSNLAVCALLAILVLPVLVGLYLIVGAVVQTIAASECFEQGYAGVKMDYKFKTYCIDYTFRSTVPTEHK